jgi:Winged helix DNA-binding domain
VSATVDELRRERFAAQLLSHERGRDAVAVAERLLAVQAQDLTCMRLAIRARAQGVSCADIDRALTDERSVVIGWLGRATLHLVRREDYWWLHALTTPPLFTGNARRLSQTGVDARAAERGVTEVRRALIANGPLTRGQLRERLDRAGVPTAGQALVHVLMLACLRAIAVRGPIAGAEQAYAFAPDWLGAAPRVDRDRALGELARRYLAGHGPADDRDLARWAGLPLREARSGLRAISRLVAERGDGRMSLSGRGGGGGPRAILLERWDPLLVGWRSRDWLLGAYPERERAELHFRPFAYAGGRAVATWTRPRGAVSLDAPFAPPGRAGLVALRREAEDVRRFLARD